MSLVSIFNLGMYRKHPEPLPDKTGLVLNLGPGEKHIDGSVPLEYPEWDAEYDSIPFADGTVDMIHCYHFLEHIQNTWMILDEIHRVLRHHGHINIVVPYYSSQLQAQDPDHKKAFTENTWRTIFDSTRYKKDKSRPLKVYTNFIMGDCEKNLVLITQLVKEIE